MQFKGGQAKFPDTLRSDFPTIIAFHSSAGNGRVRLPLNPYCRLRLGSDLSENIALPAVEMSISTYNFYPNFTPLKSKFHPICDFFLSLVVFIPESSFGGHAHVTA